MGTTSLSPGLIYCSCFDDTLVWSESLYKHFRGEESSVWGTFVMYQNVRKMGVGMKGRTEVTVLRCKIRNLPQSRCTANIRQPAVQESPLSHPCCLGEGIITLYLLLFLPELQDQKGQQRRDGSFPALSGLGPAAAPPGPS